MSATVTSVGEAVAPSEGAGDVPSSTASALSAQASITPEQEHQPKKHADGRLIELVLKFVRDSPLKQPETGNITMALVREVERLYDVKETTLRRWIKCEGKRDKSGRPEYFNDVDLTVLVGAVELAGQHNAVVDVNRFCEMVRFIKL